MGAGEVLLENVDLRLEAFDSLQLPLSIKQGMWLILEQLYYMLCVVGRGLNRGNVSSITMNALGASYQVV